MFRFRSVDSSFSLRPQPWYTGIRFGKTGPGSSQEIHLLPQPLQRVEQRSQGQDTPGLERFVVMGDFGTGDKHQQRMLAALMSRYHHRQFANLFLLGDQAYGKHKDDSTSGKPCYYESQIGEPLSGLADRGIRVHALPGNADVRNGMWPFQQQYFGQPQRYGKISIQNVDIFKLDTTALLPGYKDCHVGMPVDEAQWQWLEQTLKESKADYKIIMGHYPLYISAGKGDAAQRTQDLRQRMEHLIEKYGVCLYISGDKHYYERKDWREDNRDDAPNYVHLVSGGGGQAIDRHTCLDYLTPENTAVKKGKRRIPAQQPDVRLFEHHFLTFRIKKNKLKIKAINGAGKVIDKLTIRKPANKEELVTVSRQTAYWA